MIQLLYHLMLLLLNLKFLSPWLILNLESFKLLVSLNWQVFCLKIEFKVVFNSYSLISAKLISIVTQKYKLNS